MRVQRIRLTQTDKATWIVLDDSNKLIQPIRDYLRYLDNTGKSPNTIHGYAGHLKLFWEFLRDYQLDWETITLIELSEFIPWLRQNDLEPSSMEAQESKRSETTINQMISTVYNFYEFHRRNGTVKGIDGYQERHIKKKYKPFLHHISKGKPTSIKLLKLKEPKKLPKVLEKEQVESLIQACHHIRDKFLLILLYETGIRIGQALGLRHQDIRSWDNEIDVIFRDDNANNARSKSPNQNIIHVSKELMGLYSQYLIEEYPEDIDSDYVFVNIWNGKKGKPLNYSTVNGLFNALEKRTSIKVTPHMFRHTHATELIRSGWNIAYVQKRLGHSSVQTTINTYAHLDNDDMKKVYEEYIEKWKK